MLQGNSWEGVGRTAERCLRMFDTEDRDNGDCTVCGGFIVEGQRVVDSEPGFLAHLECWVPAERV